MRRALQQRRGTPSGTRPMRTRTPQHIIFRHFADRDSSRGRTWPMADVNLPRQAERQARRQTPIYLKATLSIRQMVNRFFETRESGVALGSIKRVIGLVKDWPDIAGQMGS